MENTIALDEILDEAELCMQSLYELVECLGQKYPASTYFTKAHMRAISVSLDILRKVQNGESIRIASDNDKCYYVEDFDNLTLSVTDGGFHGSQDVSAGRSQHCCVAGNC